jgi:hypothetical protein
MPLPKVATIGDLTDPAKCPNGECWFYDQASGLLFLNMVQEKPNAGGPYSSPLGTCGGTANGPCADESFYSCPATGCELYTVLVDSAYKPTAASDCTPYGGSPDYTQPYPSDLNQLAYSDGTVITTSLKGSTAFPHQALTNEPATLCPTHAPSTPDWSPPPASAVPAIFTVGLPAGVTASISGAAVIDGTGLYPLLPGSTHTLSATGPGSGASNACKQSFTVNTTGQGFTSSGGNCCQMGTGSSNNQLGIAAPPYGCAGP